MACRLAERRGSTAGGRLARRACSPSRTLAGAPASIMVRHLTMVTTCLPTSSTAWQPLRQPLPTARLAVARRSRSSRRLLAGFAAHIGEKTSVAVAHWLVVSKRKTAHKTLRRAAHLAEHGG
jgi:hypothetical protein